MADLHAFDAVVESEDDEEDEDFDHKQAERDDHEAELEVLRKQGAPGWMQRVVKDEIEALRRHEFWRTEKESTDSPVVDFFVSQEPPPYEDTLRPLG